MNSSLFKAYDVRGIYPDEINEGNVETIGRAFVQWLKVKCQLSNVSCVVARDVRLSGPAFLEALAQGLIAEGARVIDIGVVTTEMLYFAVAYYGYDAGIMVSASHNEGKYNGLKFVREGAQAISSDSGLFEIRDIALNIKEAKQLTTACGGVPLHSTKNSGGTTDNLQLTTKNVLDDYVDYLLQKFAPKNPRSFRIVANANFGMSGKVLERLVERGKLPVTIVPLDFEPNGAFPKGKPDPSIPERRQETEALVKKEKPDFGVAWDADADRSFFFDERGDFVDGYYMIAILAKYLLAKYPGEAVIYDVRFTWASRDAITAAGGRPIINKPGHTFLKDRIRTDRALFAGENSGHYYFRDFFGVDSGMIPFLLVLDILSETHQPFSALADPYRRNYPISGEINSKVAYPNAVMEKVAAQYRDGIVEHIDGLSVEYPDWRFNLRKSNTEPLLRLCVEAKTDALVRTRTDTLLSLIR